MTTERFKDMSIKLLPWVVSITIAFGSGMFAMGVRQTLATTEHATLVARVGQVEVNEEGLRIDMAGLRRDLMGLTDGQEVMTQRQEIVLTILCEGAILQEVKSLCRISGYAR